MLAIRLQPPMQRPTRDLLLARKLREWHAIFEVPLQPPKPLKRVTPLGHTQLGEQLRALHRPTSSQGRLLALLSFNLPGHEVSPTVLPRTSRVATSGQLCQLAPKCCATYLRRLQTVIMATDDVPTLPGVFCAFPPAVAPPVVDGAMPRYDAAGEFRSSGARFGLFRAIGRSSARKE